MTKNPYARMDPETKRARGLGYPARSVFKLEEIDRRVNLLTQGAKVLDLGASPGSWTLYAAAKVGGRGRVLAVDLKPVAEVLPPQVVFQQLDVFELEPQTLCPPGPFEVVLSDMAPSTSGSKVRDQAASAALFLRALELSRAVGSPGSSFAAKLFMGPEFEKLRAEVRASFGRVLTMRPQTTRKPSSEVFIVGLSRKA